MPRPTAGLVTNSADILCSIAHSVRLAAKVPLGKQDLQNADSEIVVFPVGNKHSDGATQVDQKAADIQVPKLRLSTLRFAKFAVLDNLVAEQPRIFPMSILLGVLPFQRIGKLELGSQKMRISPAIAVFHDVDVVNIVKLDRNVQMLKKDFSPGNMSGLHDPQGGSRKNKLVVAVDKIIAFHKLAKVVNQPQVHATEHQHVFSRRGVRATFRASTMNFHVQLSAG